MANERIRSIRVPLPPASGDARVDQWTRDVTNSVNGLPISIFSTSDGPNASRVTSPEGFLGIEVGSSATRFWVKNSGSTSTGWRALALAQTEAYGGLDKAINSSAVTMTGVSTSTTTFTAYDAIGASFNVSASTQISAITLTHAGAYHLGFSWAGRTGTATRVFFNVYANGSPRPHGASTRINNANDTQTITFASLDTFGANTLLSVGIKTDKAGGEDVGTETASLDVHKIADL